MNRKIMRDSICQLRLQQGKMEDKIELLSSKDMQKSKIIQEVLRTKIYDTTRIRDNSIAELSDLINKNLNEMRKSECENNFLNQEYEKMKRKENIIDLQIKNVLEEIEIL